MSYLTGPVSVMTLPRIAPELHRPFRLRGLLIVAGIAFTLSAELLYLVKGPLTSQIIGLVVVAVMRRVFYLWGVKFGRRTPSIEAQQTEVHEHLGDLKIPSDEEESERTIGY